MGFISISMVLSFWCGPRSGIHEHILLELLLLSVYGPIVCALNEIVAILESVM